MKRKLISDEITDRVYAVIDKFRQNGKYDEYYNDYFANNDSSLFSLFKNEEYKERQKKYAERYAEEEIAKDATHLVIEEIRQELKAAWEIISDDV